MRFLLLLFVLLFCGCSSTPQATAGENANQQHKRDIVFSGKVIWVAIEGGFFGLEDDAGRQYLPDHIPASLKRDGQPVRVTARPAPPTVGYRMWGRRIIIEEITAR